MDCPFGAKKDPRPKNRAVATRFLDFKQPEKEQTPRVASLDFLDFAPDKSLGTGGMTRMKRSIQR